MSGSHRADKSGRGPLPRRAAGWAVVAVLVALILVGSWLGARAWLGDGSEPSAAPSSDGAPALPSPTRSVATATPNPTSTAAAPGGPSTPKAQVKPTTPANLPKLRPDQPRRLTLDGLLDTGFDNAVDARGDTLEPASDAEVSRWARRGSPGSPGEDAVVVIGVDRPGGALEDASRIATGEQLKVRTDQGTLTYTVGEVARVDHSRLLRDERLTDTSPARLVLVAERYAASGDRLTQDLVVVAILTAAEPA